MKELKYTSPRPAQKISHDELTAILYEIAENPPAYATIFIKPKFDKWPYVKSLCIESATMAVEVDDDIFVATWEDKSKGRRAYQEMKALDEVILYSYEWDEFHFLEQGEESENIQMLRTARKKEKQAEEFVKNLQGGEPRKE